MIQNIIITGGTGFIGRYVVKQLMRERYRITLVCRDIKKAQILFKGSNIKFIQHDLDSREELELDCNKSILIHLAWSTLDSYHSEAHLTQHLPNHITFLEGLLRNGLKSIIISGTCFEYGLVDGQIPPYQSAAPVCNYARAKNNLHTHMRQIQNKYSYCLHWARIFYVYGEGESSKTLLGQLKSAIQNKETIFNMSRGDQKRDFIHVNEVAKHLIKLIRNQQSGVTNICTGKPKSVNQFVDQYLQLQQTDIKLNKGYYEYNAYEPMYFWGQPGTAKQ